MPTAHEQRLQMIKELIDRTKRATKTRVAAEKALEGWEEEEEE